MGGKPKICPFFAKNGSCKKGANCDMVHSLPVAHRGRTAIDLDPANEAGGYQYRTVARVLGKNVETMLYGCAGRNHVTEELVVGMLNHAKSLGIGTEDPRFPILKFERWVHPEFVHGIAAGSPVPIKGAPVITVRLLEGKAVATAASSSEDALGCESRHGLAFRPALDYHMLDTLGVRLPRCEDHSRTWKAYA